MLSHTDTLIIAAISCDFADIDAFAILACRFSFDILILI